MTRRSKYGNTRTVVDGISFASKAEAKRYGELKLLERAGEIVHLRLQPEFKLWGRGGTVICKYRADFAYMTIGIDGMMQSETVEDVKGVRTPVYRLKAKMFQDCYGFAITEVPA